LEGSRVEREVREELNRIGTYLGTPVEVNTMSTAAWAHLGSGQVMESPATSTKETILTTDIVNRIVTIRKMKISTKLRDKWLSIDPRLTAFKSSLKTRR
jgi:hypothetical protein